MRWEMIAAVVGGIAIAWGLVAWPRLVLICTGLMSLMLGLLSLVSLKTITTPSLITVFAGIGLIGFGAFVGRIEALLTDTRLKPRGDSGTDYFGSTEAYMTPGSFRLEGRVEPRIWEELETARTDNFRVSSAEIV